MAGAEREVLDAAGVERALDAIAAQILESGDAAESLAIIGIRRRGVPMADRLTEKVAALAGDVRPRTGALDITLYRDDLTLVADQPVVSGTEIAYPVDGLRVVLADDVLFTGRTVRAAIDALFGLGRPAKIELAVLVDRGHRELPIEASYVGVRVDTARAESVHVFLQEIDGQDRVSVVATEG